LAENLNLPGCPTYERYLDRCGRNRSNFHGTGRWPDVEGVVGVTGLEPVSAGYPP
jgi:hypothetical protein